MFQHCENLTHGNYKCQLVAKLNKLVWTTESENAGRQILSQCHHSICFTFYRGKSAGQLQKRFCTYGKRFTFVFVTSWTCQDSFRQMVFKFGLSFQTKHVMVEFMNKPSYFLNFDLWATSAKLYFDDDLRAALGYLEASDIQQVQNQIR